MVNYCCVYGCYNSSFKENISFHGFPKNKSLAKVWTSKIKRDPKRDFKVTIHTKVCSEHFKDDDFLVSDTKAKRLKKGACPSLFSWNKKEVKQRSIPEKRRKLEISREQEEAERTETASEGEGEVHRSDGNNVSRSVQADIQLECNHRFTVSMLQTPSHFKHFTGFNDYERFMEVLHFIVPNLDRNNIIYWNTKSSKEVCINTSLLFDSDRESESQSDEESESEASAGREHVLLLEDEFLLVMMKLRLGLTNLDLAVRFRVSEGTVSNIFITWVNFLYARLGSLKIWPHRRVIMDNMPQKFKEEYPNTIIIIDCTELRIQCPSSLLVQSQSYSNYKSTNTLKGLVGVDPLGGFMFISQLYTGSISDKEIVTRSGFLDLLSRKKEFQEIETGDAIMADKGFDIQPELKTLGLNLNIPPFLKEKSQFEESEVIKTQTVAKHRIHVERAIGKVRRFRIFSNRLAISSLGTINQLWTVCCLLSNFMNPVLTDGKSE